jgi:hypothetical protein
MTAIAADTSLILPLADEGQGEYERTHRAADDPNGDNPVEIPVSGAFLKHLLEFYLEGLETLDDTRALDADQLNYAYSLANQLNLELEAHGFGEDTTFEDAPF